MKTNALLTVFFGVHVALLSLCKGYAQSVDKGIIDPQRPTLTESYSIVQMDILQFENGLDYFVKDKSIGVGTFLRGSVSNRTEIRISTDYTSLNLAGLKFVVLDPENNGLKLGASMVYSRMLLSDVNDFRFVLSKSHKKFFSSYNFGHDDKFYNIILAGYSLTNTLNYFLEYYNEPAHHQLHSGFTWIPVRDLQLDVNGGWVDSHDWYWGFGASFRIR